MSMFLSIIPESGFLRVIAAGEFSLDEAERTYLNVIDAVAEHKSEKILFDGRELTGEPQVMERFYYGKFAAEKCQNILYSRGCRAPRFAYVLREPVLDPGRFGETVAINRGMIVKAFANLDGAHEWLGVAPASKPEGC